MAIEELEEEKLLNMILDLQNESLSLFSLFSDFTKNDHESYRCTARALGMSLRF